MNHITPPPLAITPPPLTPPALARGRRVAVIVKGWPRLSETFIAQEILGLERLGVEQFIVSLRLPTDRVQHALTRAIQAPVLYLPEFLCAEPERMRRAVARARRLPGWADAFKAWRRDLTRDPTRGRTRRFGQACVLATEMPEDIGWLHAHFLHTPASVTRYASLLTGLAWSFSAHAKDIWTSPDWEMREKLKDCAWGVTCTGVGHAHLASLAPEPERIELLYHGLDFNRFPDTPRARSARDGADPAQPARLLSVGRAVEKKGFDVLLRALAALPAGLAWRWTHIGGGERLKALKAQAAHLGLEERIDWRGAQTQDRVIEAYRAADLFVLPCRTARDGDQDGLPNVLMEAQTMGLACLATTTSAIPELILDQTTGVLVEPGDAPALAQALAALIGDPRRRQRLGEAGRTRVRATFTCEPGIQRLAKRFLQLGERRGDVGCATLRTLPRPGGEV